MFVRTSFAGYQERADIFAAEVASRVKDLQWFTAEGTTNGGPIIMTQVSRSGQREKQNVLRRVQ